MFDTLNSAPSDPLFGIFQAFKEDSRQDKVNLSLGTYKTAELKPYILSAVKQAELLLLQREESKDYLPIDGDPSFVRSIQELIFHDDHEIYAAQTLGGTGALRLAGEFLFTQGLRHVYFSNPTWGNHRNIFAGAGFETYEYPYFDHRTFQFEGMLDTIDGMKPNSVIVLQPCCHNPTGIDLTREQWEVVVERISRKGVFPLFDFAYQGFGEGIESDSWAIRLFQEKGCEMMVALSCSKSFGLYAERVGALYVKSPKHVEIGSHMRRIIRSIYSNPPCHGARLVALVLSRPDLRSLWADELTKMRDRIRSMRQTLYTKIHSHGPFGFIEQQKGMFCYTGLTADQVRVLRSEFGIYMTLDGRINVAGLNTENVSYVAEAMISVS